MSTARQASRHVRTHPAEANHSNLHNKSLIEKVKLESLKSLPSSSSFGRSGDRINEEIKY
jgi:hypothetical protein